MVFYTEQLLFYTGELAVALQYRKRVFQYRKTYLYIYIYLDISYMSIYLFIHLYIYGAGRLLTSLPRHFHYLLLTTSYTQRIKTKSGKYTQVFNVTCWQGSVAKHGEQGCASLRKTTC